MAEEKQTNKIEPGKENKIVENAEKKTEKKVETPKKTEAKKEVKEPEKIKEEVKSVQEKELEFKKEIKEKPAEPKKTEEGQEYVIPLRKRWKNVPRYKRAKKAVKSVREFLVRHMKVRDGNLNKIKIDKYLNEAIWARGIRKPLSKVKVKVIKDGDVFRAELVDMPEKLKYKKLRLERREQKAQDFADGKKMTKKLEEKVQEQPVETAKEIEEKKKEESEKKASVIEAGEKQKKAAAKQAKHQTKISKGPKRPKRKALEK